MSAEITYHIIPSWVDYDDIIITFPIIPVAILQSQGKLFHLRQSSRPPKNRTVVHVFISHQTTQSLVINWTETGHCTEVPWVVLLKYKAGSTPLSDLYIILVDRVKSYCCVNLTLARTATEMYTPCWYFRSTHLKALQTQGVWWNVWFRAWSSAATEKQNKTVL